VEPDHGHARRTWRGRRLAGATALVLALALTAACSSGRDAGSGPDGGDAGASADAAGAGGAGDAGGDGADVQVDLSEPVDVEAALVEFEAPPEETGLPGPAPEHCPGADVGPMLAAFPDARPFQATSLVVDAPDAEDDEVHVQCRMSYEFALADGDECTVMEVRDVFFRADAQSPNANDGTLTVTSVMTYFAGGARKDGVVLDYTLSAGCDEAQDLSDLESDFRTVWHGHRDRFLEAPTYERP
jgi:hypothetical protein